MTRYHASHGAGMSDIGEGLGSAVEGAMAARVVEPKAGEAGKGGSGVGKDGHTHEANCLNCGTALIGNHCHECGQRAHIHRSLGAFFHDLLHGVLHFEGKFWRTMPVLIWRPGRLTREYIDGKRARYLSPIALFLFTVFVSFALWSALGGFGEIENPIDTASQEEIGASTEMLRDEVRRLEQQRDAAIAAGEPVDDLDVQIISAQSRADLLETLAGDDEIAPQAEEVRLPVEVSTTDNAPENFATWLEGAWSDAKTNPKLLLYRLQTNAYKLSWLLIPLSLPFMWLLFPFSRRFRLYDHTVFVTYSISFMTMLVVLASMGSYLGAPWVTVPALLYAPFHIYRQLRGTYALGRLSALVRLIPLTIFAQIALLQFLLIMVWLVIN